MPKEMYEEKTCGTCRFSRPIANNEMEVRCHKNAPTPWIGLASFQNDLFIDDVVTWPKMEITDDCGQWEPRE